MRKEETPKLMAKHASNQNRNIPGKIITAILVFCMIFCCVKIGQDLWKYWKAEQNAIAARDLAGEKDVDFEKLQAMNPDIKAWIYGKDTSIDYPVAQSKDNNDYLHTAYDGVTYSPSGTLFIDQRAKEPFSGDFSTIIYGHHMKDGTKFGTLIKWRDQEYYNAHKNLYLFTPNQKYRLEIFAVNTVPSDDELYTNVPYTEEEKITYINKLISDSKVKTDVSVGTEDHIVILSTCAYEFNNARCIAACKAVPIEDNKATIRKTKKEDDSLLGFIKFSANAIKSSVQEYLEEKAGGI